MKPKDNSDMTMLIYSDYLEEQGNCHEAQEIREEINKGFIAGDDVSNSAYTWNESQVGTPWPGLISEKVGAAELTPNSREMPHEVGSDGEDGVGGQWQHHYTNWDDYE
jgi:hypothetical protein